MLLNFLFRLFPVCCNCYPLIFQEYHLSMETLCCFCGLILNFPFYHSSVYPFSHELSFTLVHLYNLGKPILQFPENYWNSLLSVAVLAYLSPKLWSQVLRRQLLAAPFFFFFFDICGLLQNKYIYSTLKLLFIMTWSQIVIKEIELFYLCGSK